MGKIERAIRQASLRHEAAQKQGAHDRDAGGQVDDTSDTQSALVPVLFRPQPGCKHVPTARALERSRIIHDGYSEEALTNYKMLRTRILQQLGANEWNTLAITSAHDGAGKTVTAINLAMTLASQGGHEIYLVDLDLRNPSVADYFGLPADIPGLAAYLDRETELCDILWDVGVENLVVLANRDRMADSSERLTSKRMQDLFSIFKSASPKPIIILDLPPVLTADDVVAVSPFVDAGLMVVSEGETTRDGLGQALDLLRNANIIGVVLNKSGGR